MFRISPPGVSVEPRPETQRQGLTEIGTDRARRSLDQGSNFLEKTVVFDLALGKVGIVMAPHTPLFALKVRGEGGMNFAQQKNDFRAGRRLVQLRAEIVDTCRHVVGVVLHDYRRRFSKARAIVQINKMPPTMAIRAPTPFMIMPI